MLRKRCRRGRVKRKMVSGPERERPISEEEEIKSLADVVRVAFKKLIEKIKELVNKKKLSEEEKKLLDECQKEREARKKEFFRANEGARKKRDKVRNKARNVLDKALGELQGTSADKWDDKFKEVEKELRSQGGEARKIGEEEEAKISDPKFQGVVEEELEGIIGKREREKQKLLKARKGEEVGVSRETEIGDIESKGETEKAMLQKLLNRANNLQREIAEGKGDSQTIAELSHINSMMPRGSDYKLSSRELEKLKKGGKERDEVFMKLLKAFGLDPGRHFRETDLTSQSRWVDFMVELFEIDPLALEAYTALFGFEETLHNLELYLGGQADITRIKEIVSGIKSGDLDVAVRQKGAVVAFRTYEQAYARLALIDEKFTPAKLTRDPDTGKIWIDEWVQEKVRETLTNYLMKTRALGTWEEAEQVYKEEFLPYEATFLRTGHKILTFTLRAHEIQAQLPASRDTDLIGAPQSEDLSRVLDPLQLPLRYWGTQCGAMGILGVGEDLGTKLHSFYSGEYIKFKNPEEWKRAMESLGEKKMLEFNLFNIGGILSVSLWRSTEALKNVIPKELARFLGIETEQKVLRSKWGGNKEEFEAKEEAFRHGLIRNPLGVFLSAAEKDQDEVLKLCGVDLTEKKDFYESVYDDMAQALQRLVYRQTEGLKGLLYEYDDKGNVRGVKKLSDEAIQDFLEKEGNRGLNFDFVDVEQRKKLEGFVGAIQRYFDQEENLRRLAEKKQPFSIGTEDAPLEIFRFTDCGDPALQRRFRDLSDAANATHAFWTYIGGLGPILQKDEEIIKGLKEIHSPLLSYGGSDVADKKILQLVDSTLELIEEDGWQKFWWWPISELRDKWGLTSKAEKLFGQYALSYNKEEMRLLVEKMIGAHLFAGMEAKEVRKVIFDKHKLWRRHIWGQKAWRYGPGVLVGLAASAILIIIQQFKKDVEEVVKEA
jgi:hypothetical protein